MDPREVNSREGLVRFIGGLRDEHVADPAAWENSDLDSFLAALGAWTRDAPGYFENIDRPMPPEPTWELIAVMLQAAAVYE